MPVEEFEYNRPRDCVDTLRLSERAAMAVFSQLDENGGVSSSAELRQDERVTYHRQDGLVVEMTHPGGSRAYYIVRPRNLSRNGLAFLHGGFVYTDTATVVMLIRSDGRRVRVPGRVLRCRHVRGNIHEIGLRFDEPIRMSDFVAGYRDEAEDQRTRTTPDQHFLGRVMVIDDAIDDRDILGFWLGDMGLKTKLHGDLKQARKQLQISMVDLVLVDSELENESAGRILRHLRATGYPGPVVAITSDDDPALMDQLVETGYGAVLTKPVGWQDLAMLLSCYLRRSERVETHGEYLLSQLWANHQLRPLIRQFLGRLLDHCDQIERAITENAEQSIKLCRDLKGTSGNYGYPTISAKADELARRLQDQSGLNEVKQSMTQLHALCVSACQVRQQAG